MPPSFIPHSAQLDDVWLEAVEFERSPGYDFSVLASYSMATGREISIPEDDDLVARIRVSLDLEWSPVEGETTQDFVPPFELDITMAALFRWPEARPAENRREWIEYNGMYLVWPYLRAQVAAIVAASDLPRFTLPTLAVPRPEEWADTEEREAADTVRPDQAAG